MNRSPLFYATYNNHKESFLELIRLRAGPWDIQSNQDYFTGLLKNFKRVL